MIRKSFGNNTLRPKLATFLDPTEARNATAGSVQAWAPFQSMHLGRWLAAGDLNDDGRIDALVVPHNESLVCFQRWMSTSGGRGAADRRVRDRGGDGQLPFDEKTHDRVTVKPAV
jgi:hypothetical protein